MVIKKNGNNNKTMNNSLPSFLHSLLSFGKRPTNVQWIAIAITLLLLVLWGRQAVDDSLPAPLPKSPYEPSLVFNNNNKNSNLYIPKVVHQMWKDHPENIPHDLQRWRNSCMKVNDDFDFKLYLDDDLKTFVHDQYPNYVELFDSLHGVYMADMARMLVVYHYGGIYMDLDFYCHRPFHCLLNALHHEINQPKTTTATTTDNSNSNKNEDTKSYFGATGIDPNAKNLLVVSREPLVHAHIFQQKQRVVIQDFFMTTPKHPFLKWMLDDRAATYQAEKLKPNPQHNRGPFSYAIEKDIDRYYAFLNQAEPKNPTEERGHIVELPESILHSLVDQTNSKLYRACNSGEESIPIIANESCGYVNNGEFFRPTKHTVAVHMWSHVYLGWNYVRSWYSSRIYRAVEQKVPPTLSCIA